MEVIEPGQDGNVAALRSAFHVHIFLWRIYELSEEIPYDGAKLMYQIKNIDDKNELKNIIIDTYNDLK